MACTLVKRRRFLKMRKNKSFFPNQPWGSNSSEEIGQGWSGRRFPRDLAGGSPSEPLSHIATQPHSHIAIQPHSYIATQPQSHIATQLHSHKGGGLWPPPQRGAASGRPPFVDSFVATQLCSYVALWLCSDVATWLYGYVAKFPNSRILKFSELLPNCTVSSIQNPKLQNVKPSEFSNSPNANFHNCKTNPVHNFKLVAKHTPQQFNFVVSRIYNNNIYKNILMF